MCKILANMTQVSDVAPGPLVFFFLRLIWVTLIGHFYLGSVRSLYVAKIKSWAKEKLCRNA
jgi:hypothetical protein